jgi:hypothetical protein
MKRTLFWLPRILGIVFALFISLFALDVFGEGYGFWQTLVALLIHLVPTYLVIIGLVLAWRWEWTGAVWFTALGLWYLFMARGNLELPVVLLIPGPLFMIAILFLISWFYRDKSHTDLA